MEFIKEIKIKVFDENILIEGNSISITLFNEDGYSKHIDGEIVQVLDDVLSIEYSDGEWMMIHEITIEDVENGRVQIS